MYTALNISRQYPLVLLVKVRLGGGGIEGVKAARTIWSMRQRGDVEHLGCFQCLEGSIMKKF